MFSLILDASIVSALLFLALSLESGPQSNVLTRMRPDCTSIVSRYVVIALAAFPSITFARLREGERALQRAGTKLLLAAGVFSGHTYLSELLISALVSIVFLSAFAARRWIRRLMRWEVKLQGRMPEVSLRIESRPACIESKPDRKGLTTTPR